MNPVDAPYTYKVDIRRVKFRRYVWNIQLGTEVTFGVGRFSDAKDALMRAIRKQGLSPR